MIKAYKAKWIITAEDKILENHVIIVKNNKIAHIIPEEEFKEETIPFKDFGNAVITPGFVDLFTRLELTGINDLREISIKSFLKRIFLFLKNLFLLTRIEKDSYLKKVSKTQIEYKSWGKRYKLKSIQKGLEKLVCSGTTTFAQRLEDKSCYKFFNRLNIRKYLFFEVLSDSNKKSRKEYFRIVKLIEKLNLKKSDKTHLGIAPHSISTVDPDLLKALAKFSRKKDILLMINFMQTEDELDWLKLGFSPINIYQKLLGLKPFAPAKTEISPVEYIKDLELLNENTILLNANYLTKNNIEELSQTPVNLVYLPRVNDKINNRKLPLHSFMYYFKQKFGFGTDSLAYNYDSNLFNEAKYANQNGEMTLEELVKYLTIYPAKILKIDDKTGSLKAGKYADFNVFRLENNSELNELKNKQNLEAVFIGGSQYVKNGKIIKPI